MSTSLIDISVPLGPSLPVWPGSAGIRVTKMSSLAAGDDHTSSRLDCDVHAGTHVDAPAHFLPEGSAVDTLSLDVLIGPAIVAGLPEAHAITSANLAGLHLPQARPGSFCELATPTCGHCTLASSAGSTPP